MSKQFYIKQFSLVQVEFQCKKIPFQTIQFSISTQFKCKYPVYLSKTFLFQAIQFSQTIQFSIRMPLVLFNLSIGPYQVLPFRARVNLGAMAMKGCSAFPKAAASLEPHHQIVWNHIQDTLWDGGVLPLCRTAVGVFYSPSRLGDYIIVYNVLGLDRDTWNHINVCKLF